MIKFIFYIVMALIVIYDLNPPTILFDRKLFLFTIRFQIVRVTVVANHMSN
jgi:hypothetical protein